MESMEVLMTEVHAQLSAQAFNPRGRPRSTLIIGGKHRLLRLSSTPSSQQPSKDCHNLAAHLNHSSTP
eukprot:scaffold41528_cov19-Tisochrysis_lutea.AAC.1